MIYFLISLRLALPGSTTDPREERGRAQSPEAHQPHPPFFLFLFLSHTLLFYFFIFLGGWGGGGVGQGGIRELPRTGGWLPHGNVFNPPTHLYSYIPFFLGGGSQVGGPDPQGPQPMRVVRVWPAEGLRDQSGGGEVVASCWGFAS